MNPVLGVILHAIGGFSSASFYVPVHKVRIWAWETFWVTLGFVAWIVMPQIAGFLTTSDLWGIIRQSPTESLAYCYMLGAMWGVGGLTCGLCLRYLGISLGQSISLGFCAAFGTLIPPIYEGKMGELVATTSGQYTLLGVAVCLAGIALCGKAGMLKEKLLTDEQKKEVIKDFNLAKGLTVAIFGGIMSACFAFAINAGKPIAQVAIAAGTEKVFSNNAAYVLIMGGGFTTNFIAAMILNARNKTFGNYIMKPRSTLMSNYFFAALSGSMWYGQFFFYGMGTTKMGKYDFASWSIHMACIIVFSNLWGIFLKEWHRVDRKTKTVLWAGILTLILSVVLVGYGNKLAANEKPTATQEARVVMSVGV